MSLRHLAWRRACRGIDGFTILWVTLVIVAGAIYHPAATIAQKATGQDRRSDTVLAARPPAIAGVNVRTAPFGAKGDGRSDDTAAIQAAIDQAPRVYLPAGIYRIDPRIGLILHTGTQLVGDGRSNTLLVADEGGGTLRDLKNYGPGSLLHRRFDPDGKNPYVSYVYLADFGIIMAHPRTSVTQDAVQIGIDFRNVSRSVIERVHVGNVPPDGTRLRKTGVHTLDSQGYGIVLGTVPSSLLSYAGGEMNVVRDTSVWGAYKAIVQDDAELSPRSAAHATLIERADLQGAQALLSQESRYAHAFVWRDNILQNVVPRPDGVELASVLRIDGRNARVDGGYIEAGGLARYIVYLGPDATRVAVDPAFTSCTNTPANVDLGRQNRISVGDDCPATMRARP